MLRVGQPTIDSVVDSSFYNTTTAPAPHVSQCKLVKIAGKLQHVKKSCLSKVVASGKTSWNSLQPKVEEKIAQYLAKKPQTVAGDDFGVSIVDYADDLDLAN
ncbi:hypothetical protein DOTSEDRAFT_74061, partial [Dothistroma septosporum NZE10]